MMVDDKAIENRQCKDYNIPIVVDDDNKSKNPESIENRKCKDYDIPIKSRNCKDYDIPIENRKCKDYDIPIENRECKDYDIPIENRNCKDYDIPIENRECKDYDIPIENRKCKDYDIPIEKKNDENENDNDDHNRNTASIENRKCKDYDISLKGTTTDTAGPVTVTISNSDAHESSVISKDEIASRVIKEGVTRDQIEDEIHSFLQAPFCWQNEVRSFWTICMFITRLRCPPWVDLHPGFLMRGMYFFPLVGTIIGLAMATTFDFFDQSLGFPPMIAAAASTAAGWAFTICMHEDGLCDSADGLGGGWRPNQILKIMTDSRVGTYGCATFCLYTIAKVQLLGYLGESSWELGASSGAGPAIVVSQAVGRITAPYLLRLFDYIDDENGPKSSFYAFLKSAKHLVSWPRAILGIALGFTIASIVFGPEVALFVISSVLVFAHLSGRYGKRRMGGVMGDFLGAIICLSEILVLCCLLFAKSHGSIVVGLKQVTHTDAFLRFMAYIVAREIWTRVANNFPNPSPVPKTRETKNEKATIEEKEKPKLSEVKDDSPKGIANKILADPKSNFQERFTAVQLYLDVLAKPVGSLGTLETWAARLAALQRTLSPNVDKVACLIFAGDHGVAAPKVQGGEECSAYPQVVTKSVMLGLHREAAGASVLAKGNNVDLRIVDVGIILGDDQGPFADSTVVKVSPQKLPQGTKNFCVEPAMSEEECKQCMAVGRESLNDFVKETSAKAVVLGEIGIGNTTSSSALIAILTNKSTKEVCGGGAFATKEASQEAILKKIDIVDRALAKHYGTNGNRQVDVQGLDALTRLGGAEIASLVGALLEASACDIPVLVDGFIATAAALVAVSISPNVCQVLFFTSQSAEPGHRAALEKIQEIALANDFPIDSNPVLSMGLRMGEGTAALLAVPILRSSAKVLSDMATIQDILS